MTDRVFISLTGGGLARACRSESGAFEVETVLASAGVRCLATDPSNKQRVYAGTQCLGVLRSDDQGKTWRGSAEGGGAPGAPVGPAGLPVTAIAASPSQRDLIYAGTKPARLFVSTDAGARWQEILAFRRIPGRWLWLSPAEKPFVAMVQAIALSPTDPQRIVVGIEAGATVMSGDAGESWTGHLKGSLRDCHSLSYHSSDGAWVYEGGGSGGGAAFSRDGGRTWAKAGQGLDRHYGWAVAADPTDPTTWYLSVSPDPYKAHGDGKGGAQAYIFRRDGAGWRRLSSGLPQPLDHMPYALITDPAVPGSLYAGLSNGDLWHSADRGESWGQLPVNLGGIHRTLVMV